ncbi:hypothetical protein V7161_06525 [Neobacillus drentensis]
MEGCFYGDVQHLGAWLWWGLVAVGTELFSEVDAAEGLFGAIWANIFIQFWKLLL